MRPTTLSGSTVIQTAALVVALLLVATAPAGTSQSTGVRFPSLLDHYFKNAVRLTADEQQQIAAGQAVTKLLDADESKEAAVFGAIWINAPIRRYVDAVTDIENFERGGGHAASVTVN